MKHIHWHTNRFFWRCASVLILAILLITLGIPVLADYLGPDRDVTTWIWERQVCQFEAVYPPPPNFPTCLLNLYTSPGGTCPDADPIGYQGYFNSIVCPGWTASCPKGGILCSISGPSTWTEFCSPGQEGCELSGHTTHMSPATISGNINCSQAGASGWCTGPANLSLAANEPISGYSIVLIEGTRNGVNFACPGVSCTLPLEEGSNNFTFWALSTWGDSSLMGTASASVDTHPPEISGGLSGVAGENGWYVLDVTVSATASDAAPGSGLTSFDSSVDSGLWSPFPGSLIISDGPHTLDLRAVDTAGNTAMVSRSIMVDTQAPLVTSTTSLPASGWVRGLLDLSGTSVDSMSGVAALEISFDEGITWQAMAGTGPWNFSWDTSTAPDGSQTVLVRATDRAGNQGNAASLTIPVDNTPPQLSLTGPGAFCPACSDAEFGYSVADAASGVTAWSLAADGGPALISGTGPAIGLFHWDGSGLPIGKHTLTVEARDLAGNTNLHSLEVTLVEAPPPPVPASPAAPDQVLPPARPTATSTSPTASRTASPTASLTRAVSTVAFGGKTPTATSRPKTENSTPEAIAPGTQENASWILWGTAALALATEVTATLLQIRNARRKAQARPLILANAPPANTGQGAAVRNAPLQTHTRQRIAKTDSPADQDGGGNKGGDKMRSSAQPNSKVGDLLRTVQIVSGVVAAASILAASGPRLFEFVAKKFSAQAITPTITEVPCVNVYAVGEGDTLIGIAARDPDPLITANLLQHYNNIGNPDQIYEGQTILIPCGQTLIDYVNSAPTDTPVPTETRWPTPTEKTATPKTIVPTDTRWPTASFTKTPTPRVILTETRWPTPTLTLRWSLTPSITSTRSRTPFLTPTRTSTSTVTGTATMTKKPSDTRWPSQTYTITRTPTISRTPTKTLSPTITWTPSITNTPTRSFTPSITKTPTKTYTPSSTFTPTRTPTKTSTRTRTSTPTRTFTPTKTKTLTPTLTFTPTHTPTITKTPTRTATVRVCVNDICTGDMWYASGIMNVRDAPGVAGSIIYQLDCGNAVLISDVNTVTSNELVWVHVLSMRSKTNVWAAQKYLVSSQPSCSTEEKSFGNSSPVEGALRSGTYDETHYAVDIISDTNTQLESIMDGTIISYDKCQACLEINASGNAYKNTSRELNYGYGAMVIVEFSYDSINSNQKEWLETNGITLEEGHSVYMMMAHLDPNLTSITVGMPVNPGDNVGIMGNSGNSEGRHTHLELAIAPSNMSAPSTIELWQNINGGSIDGVGNKIDPTGIIGNPPLAQP